MKATTSQGMFLAAVMVYVSACGGGPKKHDDAPTTQPVAEQAKVEAPAAVKGSSMGVGADVVRARSSFALYPKSTRIVGGVSIAQLRASAAWPALKTLLDQRTTKEMKELRQVCKLDVVQVVDSLEIATSIGPNQEIILVLDGSFTRAGIGQCGPSFAKSRGHTLSVVDDGAATSYSDGTTTTWVGWPTDNRAVFGGEHDKAWIEDRLAGKDSILEDEAFMEVVGNVDTAATAWLAMVDENGNMQMLSSFFNHRSPTAAFLSLRMADVVKGEIGVVFESEDDAEAARGAIEKLLADLKGQPMFGPIVSTAHVGVYGSNAVVEFELNQQQFEQLIQAVSNIPF